MYLTFDQVILVKPSPERSYVREGDPLVYVREHPNMGRVLTIDSTEIRRELGWGDPFEYGYLYEDARGDLCVVPHVWDETDAALAKDVGGAA